MRLGASTRIQNFRRVGFLCISKAALIKVKISSQIVYKAAERYSAETLQTAGINSK